MREFQLNAGLPNHSTWGAWSNFPSVDSVCADCKKTLVVPLGTHPVDVGNMLGYVQVFKSVVFLFMGLELEVVVVLLSGVECFWVLKDDESA